MSPLTFEVSHGSWTADGQVFEAGAHELEDASPDLIRLASHAHAAGVIAVSVGLELSSVQSQEDGEAEYAKAVEDGRWMEGQLAQEEIEQAARDSGEYGAVVEVAEGGTDAE